MIEVGDEVFLVKGTDGVDDWVMAACPSHDEAVNYMQRRFFEEHERHGFVATKSIGWGLTQTGVFDDPDDEQAVYWIVPMVVGVWE